MEQKYQEKLQWTRSVDMHSSQENFEFHSAVEHGSKSRDKELWQVQTAAGKGRCRGETYAWILNWEHVSGISAYAHITNTFPTVLQAGNVIAMYKLTG